MRYALGKGIRRTTRLRKFVSYRTEMPTTTALSGRIRKGLIATFAVLVGFVSATPATLAATTVSVTADKPSGTYEAPITVSLTASDPAAKIWYVFNPDAPPGDALPYSKPLRIEKSTPLLFFAIVDRDHESKVERRDYAIVPTTLEFLAPDPVAADAETLRISVRNFGKYAVPLKGWAIRTSEESKALPVASVSAGGTATFEIAYSAGAATLSSPDGEIRSTVKVERLPPEPPKPRPVTEPAPETPISAPAKKPVVTPAPAVPQPGPTAPEPPAAAGTTTQAAPDNAPISSPAPQAPVPASDGTGSAEAAPTTPVPDTGSPGSTAHGDVPTSPENVLERIGAAPTLPPLPSPDTDPLKASAAESGTGGAGKTFAFGALAILFSAVVVRIAAIARKRRQ